MIGRDNRRNFTTKVKTRDAVDSNRFIALIFAVKSLPQFFLNELKHEVDEFVQAGGELFFNRGEVIRFGFAVILAVLAAGFAPAAGVEGIDKGGRTDEIEGVDHTLVIHSALPKLMQAVLTFKNRNGFIHVHQSTFCAAESTLGRFDLKAFDENLNFIWPFNWVVGKHMAGI